MEPVNPTLKQALEELNASLGPPILLGIYQVIETSPLGVVINIGRNVHITVHLGTFPHGTKAGDKVPLYTRLPLCLPSMTTNPTNTPKS